MHAHTHTHLCKCFHSAELLVSTATYSFSGSPLEGWPSHWPLGKVLSFPFAEPAASQLRPIPKNKIKFTGSTPDDITAPARRRSLGALLPVQDTLLACMHQLEILLAGGPYPFRPPDSSKAGRLPRDYWGWGMGNSFLFSECWTAFPFTLLTLPWGVFNLYLPMLEFPEQEKPIAATISSTNKKVCTLWRGRLL